MTLAGAPSAGEYSRAHGSKQRYKNRRTFRKHGFQREKFEDFRQKKVQKQNSRPLKNTSQNTRPLKTTVFSDNYCACYKIISVTPKSLLKTQLSEKRQSFQRKKKLTEFSPLIEYDKPQGTNYNGPQGILTITVEGIRSIL